MDARGLEIIDPSVFGGVVALIILFGILAFLALGRRLGLRALARERTAANIGSLEAAVFALLGLLIAFTFSGALSRFDLRRTQVVQEANTIRTAYLRIDLLPAPVQPGLRESFRAYTDARIAAYRKLPDLQSARQEVTRSEELQRQIWQQAVSGARLPEARAGTEFLVLSSMNDMFEIATVRVAATQIHPPSVIYAMLIALAFASALLAGYQSASEQGYDRIHKLAFAGMVALTVYVILDIEYPRLGFVRIDHIDRMLVDVRAGMK